MKKQIFASLLSLLVAVAAEPVYAQQSSGKSGASKTSLILSRIDEPVIEQFRNAWCAAGAGVFTREVVVLLYLNRDGSLTTKTLRPSNEYKRFTFKWDPSIYAIVHTHPNACNAEPQRDDIQLADRFDVPIYTITNRGMFVYDPHTRKISQVQAGLDWQKSSKWNQNSRQTVASTTAP